jgi:hypothetical protein
MPHTSCVLNYSVFYDPAFLITALSHLGEDYAHLTFYDTYMCMNLLLAVVIGLGMSIIRHEELG